MNNQPIDKVEWVDIEDLSANDYNPNKVAPPELQLLKTSILTDGWTQPIVVRPTMEIIDGFHRWYLAKNDEQIKAMTDGKVPVVYIEVSRERQMMSTVRHNRARGNHQVLKMSDLVRELIDEQGLTDEEVMNLLQMEYEEVERLYDTAGMTERGAGEDFHKGWKPGN